MKNKYLIQIGTCYGDDFFYHDFVSKYDNSIKLILIEPTDYYDEAKRFYEKTNYKFNLLKNAIVSNEFEEEYVNLYYYTDELSQLTSIIDRNDISYKRIEKAKALKINKLLLMTEPDSEIELLCLDIEGYDREVLLSMDFSLREINNIIYEAAPEDYLDKHKKIRSRIIETSLHEKLKENNFYKINNSSNEHWAKKNKEIYPIKQGTY